MLEFRVWYDNKMWCLAKLDLWGDPDQAICDLAPYLPKYEELYDIYLSDVILMQSTGLKDKNGFEIYENDLLKCTSKIYTNFGSTETGEYDETIKQVIWKDDGWGTRVISSNLTGKGAEKSGLVTTAKYAEVIGSIYQNNDLSFSGRRLPPLSEA